MNVQITTSTAYFGSSPNEFQSLLIRNARSANVPDWIQFEVTRTVDSGIMVGSLDRDYRLAGIHYCDVSITMPEEKATHAALVIGNFEDKFAILISALSMGWQPSSARCSTTRFIEQLQTI